MRKKTSYQQLKKTWYDKLKAEGFKDIEYVGTDVAKRAYPRSKAFHDLLLRDSVESYYRLCYHVLNNEKFDKDIEKVIWEYYTEGLSVRSIMAALEKTNVTVKRDSVWKVIKKYEKIMKEKYLTT